MRTSEDAAVAVQDEDLGLRIHRSRKIDGVSLNSFVGGEHCPPAAADQFEPVWIWS